MYVFCIVCKPQASHGMYINHNGSYSSESQGEKPLLYLSLINIITMLCSWVISSKYTICHLQSIIMIYGKLLMIPMG